MKPRGYLINGNFYDENISDSELDLVTPLYLEEPQTKPLSDEEIVNSWVGIDLPEECWITDEQLINFAKAIEERHGIK